MSTRCWKRLAGWLLINAAVAATPEYRAGTAAVGSVKTVALQDRRGKWAVFAEAGFPVTRAISDRVAAQLAKEYAIKRESVVLGGGGAAETHADDLFTSIAAAMGALEAARVSYNGAVISVAGEDGKCLATIPSGPCAAGRNVRAPIRAAFQIVEPPHGLQQRGEPVSSYPIQAIALGEIVTVLALSGESRYSAGKNVVVISHANDVATPADPGAAIQRLLIRVRR